MKSINMWNAATGLCEAVAGDYKQWERDLSSDCCAGGNEGPWGMNTCSAYCVHTVAARTRRWQHRAARMT